MSNLSIVKEEKLLDLKFIEEVLDGKQIL